MEIIHVEDEEKIHYTIQSRLATIVRAGIAGTSHAMSKYVPG